MPQSTEDNVVHLGFTDGRTQDWNFPDGTVITMTVPAGEPPITVQHAIYCLSEVMHRIHRAMEPN